MKPMTRTWSAALAGTAAFAALAAMMTSVNALADTTATVATPDAANASVTNINTPVYETIMKRMSVTFASTYYGGSAGMIANPYQPDEYGKPDKSSAMFFDNVLPVLYKINDDGLVAGASFNSSYTPVLGNGVTIKDPYIKVGHKSLIKSGGFTLGADLREYLPLSTAAQKINRISYLRTNQYTSYEFPNSKWSLSMVTSAYRYFYSDGDAGVKNPKWLGVINPNITYQAFSKLGIWGGYEMDFEHKNGESGALRWTNDGTWLYLGLSWDATKQFNFSPYLSIRPGGAINADSTQLTANITYVIL